MFLEIVNPERVLFAGDILSVTLPGTYGEFQILENHAPIATSLSNGLITFETKGLTAADLNNLPKEFNNIDGKGKQLSISVMLGTLEMKDNKATILLG